MQERLLHKLDDKFSTVISDHISLIEKASSLPVTSSDQVDIRI